MTDRFDGRTSKVRISLAVHDPQGQGLAVDSDDGMKNHRALRAGGPSNIGINWHYLVEKFCSLNFSAEAHSRRLSSGFRQWLGGSRGNNIHFFHDRSDFQGEVLREIAAGRKRNRLRSIKFETTLHDLHFILTGG